MTIKFVDGTIVNVSGLVEQKLFSTVSTNSICRASFSILEDLTASDVDTLLTAENIATMEYKATNEGQAIIITGYDKVNGATIRRGETTNIEVQMTKGV